MAQHKPPKSVKVTILNILAIASANGIHLNIFICIWCGCLVCELALTEVQEHIDDECRNDLVCIEDRLRDYCRKPKRDSIGRFVS